jgi:hypothetical protein
LIEEEKRLEKMINQNKNGAKNSAHYKSVQLEVHRHKLATAMMDNQAFRVLSLQKLQVSMWTTFLASSKELGEIYKKIAESDVALNPFAKSDEICPTTTKGSLITGIHISKSAASIPHRDRSPETSLRPATPPFPASKHRLSAPLNVPPIYSRLEPVKTFARASQIKRDSLYSSVYSSNSVPSIEISESDEAFKQEMPMPDPAYLQIEPSAPHASLFKKPAPPIPRSSEGRRNKLL